MPQGIRNAARNAESRRECGMSQAMRNTAGTSRHVFSLTQARRHGINCAVPTYTAILNRHRNLQLYAPWQPTARPPEHAGKTCQVQRRSVKIAMDSKVTMFRNAGDRELWTGTVANATTGQTCCLRRILAKQLRSWLGQKWMHRRQTIRLRDKHGPSIARSIRRSRISSSFVRTNCTVLQTWPQTSANPPAEHA